MAQQPVLSCVLKVPTLIPDKTEQIFPIIQHYKGQRIRESSPIRKNCVCAITSSDGFVAPGE
eukprot:6207042-Pleurochrysis_carterae.AAC.4